MNRKLPRLVQEKIGGYIYDYKYRLLMKEYLDYVRCTKYMDVNIHTGMYEIRKYYIHFNEIPYNYRYLESYSYYFFYCREKYIYKKYI